MKMPSKCTGQKFLSNSVENGEDDTGGHELVRRMGRQREVLIWRRECSGYAKQSMEPKLTNCWMDTKEFGKMKSPSQRGKELENRGRKEKNDKKGVSEAVKQFRNGRTDGAKKACGTWQQEKTMKERAELPSEDGDVVREYKAMHEEDFWSSWLREDEKGKEESKVEAEGKREIEGEKRKREEEKEENETVTV